MIPKRLKRSKMGLRDSSVIKCAGHLKWVRGHECCIAGVFGTSDIHRCFGRMEAHHSTTRGAGGGDETAVPLCTAAHSIGHAIGWETFERRFRVDLEKIAAELWKQSPHGRTYRQQHTEDHGP